MELNHRINLFGSINTEGKKIFVHSDYFYNSYKCVLISSYLRKTLLALREGRITVAYMNVDIKIF